MFECVRRWTTVCNVCTCMYLVLGRFMIHSTLPTCSRRLNSSTHSDNHTHHTHPISLSPLSSLFLPPSLPLQLIPYDNRPAPFPLSQVPIHPQPHIARYPAHRDHGRGREAVPVLVRVPGHGIRHVTGESERNGLSLVPRPPLFVPRADRPSAALRDHALRGLLPLRRGRRAHGRQRGGGLRRRSWSTPTARWRAAARPWPCGTWTTTSSSTRPRIRMTTATSVSRRSRSLSPTATGTPQRLR